MSAYNVLVRFLRPYRRLFFWTVAITAVTTAVALVPPLVIRTIIDNVIMQDRRELLVPMVLIFAALPLLAQALRFATNYLVSYMGAHLVLDMRRKLYAHVHDLPLSYFDRASSGSVMERLMGDVGQLQKLVTQQTVTLITDLVSCVVAIGAMFWLSSTLAVVPLIFVPAYLFTHAYFRRRVRKANERFRSQLDTLTSTVQERLRSTMIVKAFGQEESESRRYFDQAADAEERGTQAYTYSVAFNTAASLQTWLVRVIVTLLGYYLIVRGRMTLGDVVAFTTYINYLMGPAVRFAEMSNVIEIVSVSVRRLGEMFAEKTEPADPPHARRAGRLKGEVTFEDVTFGYDPEQPVLEEIDLHVPAGSTVALVGHTGCGKTTLISLLYRFYEIDRGRILVDGRDIHDIARRDLRANLSLVPQDPVVFEGTVHENVAYGWRRAPIDRVREAVRVAELEDVIQGLPDGLESRLGGEDAKLSVGQKQRLMIARAILPDPAILVLDEATSSLDAESEARLQTALDRVMAERTCFVIAHRLSTIVKADRIVVLDSGRIVESGTHDELLQRPDGHYRALYLRQFASVA